MSLSVIVTSYRSAALLEQCLAALVKQPDASEIVVADCSPESPAEGLRTAFPTVRVLHFATRKTVPQLRWAGISASSGEIVAALEGRCVPTSTWCAEIVRTHAGTSAPAVGGPVELKPGASPFDWGLYFAEFGLFVPPVQPGDVTQLSGANLSYKRNMLEQSRNLLAAGEWEAALHEYWVGRGLPLRLSSAGVTFHNGMTIADAFRMRFHYGWSYAAGRFARADVLRRGVYVLASPLLPAVLTFRVALHAHRKGLAGRFWRSAVWVVAFNVAWSAGEFAGYLLGRPRPHIY